MRFLATQAIQVSLRAAVAAGLAYWVARLLHADYAIYALVGAIIVTDLSPAMTRRLGWQRMAGTVIGAASGAVLLHVLPIGPIALGVAILVSMLVTYLLRLEPSAARVAGYVAAIVMLAYRADPWHYAFARAWETLLGIGAAQLVGLVPLWLHEREGDAAPETKRPRVKRGRE